MEKRKPIWLKILLWLLSTTLSIVVLLGVGCGFLYIRYQINVFEVINQINILNEKVDLNKLALNAFSDSDMASAKVVTDANLGGLITYTEQDGYKITPEEVSTAMSGELRFTDKQIGAIIDNIIESQEEINIQLGMTINLKDYGFKVVQVAFSNITETTTDFNVVIKIDLAKIKEEKMNKFPLNWIRKGVPESLYFSSTTTILKGANPFEYTTEGKSLIINNLSGEKTDSIFTTINTFLKLGNSKEFSKVIGDTFINILIGNSSNSGLAYSLKDAGATDFSFETDATNNYFVIEK
ncbi:MAG: hypothetical protein ACI4L6_00930 [Candidatus Onthoplasma sp.]